MPNLYLEKLTNDRNDTENFTQQPILPSDPKKRTKTPPGTAKNRQNHLKSSKNAKTNTEI